MDIKKINLNGDSYDIRDSRVTTNVVNGNAVWSSANSIAVTNAANGNVIKESGVSIATSLGSDNTTVPTSLAVKTAIEALPSPMIFKGSLGESGTITTLPMASASNTGYTYKVITAGTYASQAAKVGDTFISDGTNWVLIPSGDEPSGTVTSITAGTGLTTDVQSGGPIVSSGTISLDTISNLTTGSYGPSTDVTGSNGATMYVPYITVDSYGRITSIANKTFTALNTDTKNYAKIYAGSSTGASNNNGISNPYIKVGDGTTTSNAGTIRKYVRLVGSGSTTIATTDTSGTITITSPTMWSGTLSEYDGITTKDANTYYFINES